MNKRMSEILADKLVLKESFENQQLFKNSWANNNGPDIYDTELNITMTEDGDRVQETSDNEPIDNQFIVRIAKKPAYLSKQTGQK